MSCPEVLGKQPHIPERHRQAHSEVLGVYPCPVPDFLTWDHLNFFSSSLSSAPKVYVVTENQRVTDLKRMFRVIQNFLPPQETDTEVLPVQQGLLPSGFLGSLAAFFRKSFLSQGDLSPKLWDWSVHTDGGRISWGNMWAKWFPLPSGLWSIPWKSQGPPTRENKARTCNQVTQESFKDLWY